MPVAEELGPAGGTTGKRLARADPVVTINHSFGRADSHPEVVVRNDGAYVAGLICGLLIFVVIGSLILRAATWLANKCLTPSVSTRYDDDYDDDYEDDDWDSYDRPRRRSGRRNTQAIPEPTFGWGMLTVFVLWVILFVTNYVIRVTIVGGGFVRNGPTLVAVLGCNLVIDYLIASGLFTVMLPTSFPRACLVALFFILILIVVGVIIAIPLLALTRGL